MRKTGIIPHEAVERFGRTFLDSFKVLKLFVCRLPAKAAEVSSQHFWKKYSLLRRNAGRKNYILHLKSSESE